MSDGEKDGGKDDGPPVTQTPTEQRGQQGPDQRAVEQAGGQVPEHLGDDEPTEVRRVGTRRGLFGASGSGDTSGFGGLVAPVLLPGAAQRPYGGWFDEVADVLDALIDRVVVHRGEITFHVKPSDVSAVARLLRDDPGLRFELLSSVSGVHYPGDADAELHVVYQLTSMTYNRRVRVETAVPDAAPRVPSITAIYPTADWHERETYDMFGVVFEGHPALTRILMPDDWPGHPQRKDYPLGGIPVEYKGGTVPPPDERRAYN